MKRYLVATTVVTLLGFCLSAHAGKEQFERTKPHVNVGTIGYSKADTTAQGKLGNFKIQTLMSTYNQAENVNAQNKKRRTKKLVQN